MKIKIINIIIFLIAISLLLFLIFAKMDLIINLKVKYLNGVQILIMSDDFISPNIGDEIKIIINNENINAFVTSIWKEDNNIILQVNKIILDSETTDYFIEDVKINFGQISFISYFFRCII